MSLKDAILGLSPDGETAAPMPRVNEASGGLSTATVQGVHVRHAPDSHHSSSQAFAMHVERDYGRRIASFG